MTKGPVPPKLSLKSDRGTSKSEDISQEIEKFIKSDNLKSYPFRGG